jgi:hypothetical protein
MTTESARDFILQDVCKSCENCADRAAETGMDCYKQCRACAELARTLEIWYTLDKVPNTKDLVDVFKKACATCAEACGHHKEEHCQNCARACRAVMELSSS